MPPLPDSEVTKMVAYVVSGYGALCGIDARGGVTLGSAVWRKSDNNLPVTVTLDQGRGTDGRHYVSIAESSTGPPLDELHYLDEVQRE